MPDIEIKRGYEVLPDNNVRFGIRVINISEFLIFDVDVILDYSESLFNLDGNTIQNLGIINPTVPRTAEFILKPQGCIHKEEIAATVRYKDHTGKRYTLDMRPKEVHCVCPFLKGKPMNRGEFVELSESGHKAEAGLNFQGVDAARLTSFLLEICKSRHYKVDEHSIEGGTILYLASESIGEKAYYLLTAYIKEIDGLTQVMLRAVSDKPHGLNGFLNEMVGSIRHIVHTVQSAREIGIIKKEQVINIIDSVVQRTSFSGGEGAAEVNIKDSVVHRTEFKADDEQKRQEEERLRLEWEEQERKSRVEEVRAQKEKEEHKHIAKQKETLHAEEKHGGSLFAKLLVLAFVLTVLVMGISFLNQGSTDTPETIEPSTTPEIISATSQTPEVAPTANQTAPANLETFTSSIGMEFVLIPAGEFDMGSPLDEKGRYDIEGPVHNVKIEDAFYLGKYEVTQNQWQAVMGNNPSNFKGGDLPVEQISWNDAQDFIKKLNEKEGTDQYRLPSEAEWEYAARAGTSTRYSFGDNESKLGEYAWYYGNPDYKTHPIGLKKPNPWGLYDMYGNVKELVQDTVHLNYYGAPTDGSAWEESRDGLDDLYRVNRGGSWNSDIRGCRSASFDYLYIGKRDSDVGFRLLQDV